MIPPGRRRGGRRRPSASGGRWPPSAGPAALCRCACSWWAMAAAISGRSFSSSPSRGRRPQLVRGELAVEHADVEVAGAEVGVGEQGAEEGGGGADPLHAQLGEGALQAIEGALAVGGPDDQLGQHRVVVDRDLGALVDAGVHAHARAVGPAQRLDPPGRGGEALPGVLGVEADLDRRGRAAGRRRTRGRAARPRRRGSASRTRSMPVTSSVTGCSTWRRVFISRKKKLPSRSSRNSQVPALL